MGAAAGTTVAWMRVGLVGLMVALCVLVAQSSAAAQTRSSGAARKCFRRHGVAVLINGALDAVRVAHLRIGYNSVFVAGFRDLEPARVGGAKTRIHPTAFVVYEPTVAAAHRAAIRWAKTVAARLGLHASTQAALRLQHFEYHGRVLVQWDGNDSFPRRSPAHRIANRCLGPITGTD